MTGWGGCSRASRCTSTSIPLNPTPGSKWTASRPEDEKAFVEAIAAHGVPVTVRDTRGRRSTGRAVSFAATER